MSTSLGNFPLTQSTKSAVPYLATAFLLNMAIPAFAQTFLHGDWLKSHLRHNVRNERNISPDFFPKLILRWKKISFTELIVF